MIYNYLEKKIVYQKTGNGPKKVVLVHGWGGNKRSLEPLARLMGDKFSCFLIDLPGLGESDNPDTNWGVREYGDAVDSFIKNVCKNPVIYIGHSFGGALGVYLASSGSSISNLILSAPSYRRRNGRSISLVDESLNEVVVKDKSLYDRIKPYIKPLRKLVYRVLYPSSDAMRNSHLESNFRKIVKTDLSDRLSEIKIPTLILCGADDIETPLKDAYELKDGINGSKLVVHGSVGHELPVKYPELVFDSIKLFLNK